MPLYTPYTPYESRFHTGYYYGFTAGGSTTIQAEATLFAQPFFVSRPQAFDRIAVETTVAGTSGALVRMGIYADTGDGRPGSLLLDAGTTDATVTPGLLEITIAITLSGLVWLCAATQGGAGTRPTMRYNSQTTQNPAGGTSGLEFIQNAINGYRMTSVSGALNGSYTVASATAQATRVTVRAA